MAHLKNVGGKRLTREEREEILRLYLENPHVAVAKATTYGLSQLYAYKLANARGLIDVNLSNEQKQHRVNAVVR